MNSLCETTVNRFIDLKFIKLRFLLPQGEGQDEGMYKNSNLPLLDSLTPALGNRSMRYSTSCIPAVVSQREREFMGQQ